LLLGYCILASVYAAEGGVSVLKPATSGPATETASRCKLHVQKFYPYGGIDYPFPQVNLTCTPGVVIASDARTLETFTVKGVTWDKPRTGCKPRDARCLLVICGDTEVTLEDLVVHDYEGYIVHGYSGNFDPCYDGLSGCGTHHSILCVGGRSKVAITGANFTAYEGVALTVMNHAIVQLSNSIFQGGRISMEDGCTCGRGIHVGDSAQMTIFNSTFKQNEVLGTGGGVYIGGHAVVNITQSKFYKNAARYHGGGLAAFGDCTVTVLNSTFVGGKAFSEPGMHTEYGGDISVGGNATLTVTDSEIQDAAGYFGGGIAIQGAANVTINNSTIDNNTASLAGGGLHAWGTAAVVVTRSTFRNNIAELCAGSGKGWDEGTPVGGGGVFAGNASRVTIISSTFLNNSCIGDAGGDVHAAGNAHVTIINSTSNNGDSNSSSVDFMQYPGVHITDAAVVTSSGGSIHEGGLLLLIGALWLAWTCWDLPCMAC
jgi:hypothetical protein